MDRHCTVLCISYRYVYAIIERGLEFEKKILGTPVTAI